MARFFGLAGLNGTLFFGIAYLAGQAGPPEPLCVSLLIGLNPLLSLGWLPRRTDLGLLIGVTIFVTGPFMWAGFVEAILRRFVDRRLED